MRAPFITTFVLAAFITAACDSDSSGGACGNFNWRNATPSQVVCPKTPDCTCAAAGVCCVEMSGTEILSASCSPLTSCPGLAFECDGPEDCQESRVCCSVMNAGGGSSCVPVTECFGLEAFIMCRSGDDCPIGKDCLPAVDGTYFDDVAAFCQ